MHEFKEHREIPPHHLLAFKICARLDEGLEWLSIRNRIECWVRKDEILAGAPASVLIVDDPE